MRSSVLILFVSNFMFCVNAQNKVPFLFRKQDQKTTKHIHKHVRYDTLIETSGAFIHVYYSNESNKPYLLLLQGMGVDAKTNWYKQIAYLSRHYNLILPDLIYFGKSTSKEKNYSVEFQAEQVHESLKLLGISGKINVMGFSYGGLTAAIYNQFYSSEVTKLIIIDGPVKFFSGKMADSLALVSGAPSMTNIIVPKNADDFRAMQKAVISKKFPVSVKLKRKVMEHYFIPTLKIRQLQLNYLIEHETVYQNYNYKLEDSSTLLIWGAKDGVVPLSVGEKLHQRFPNTTQLLVFKKAKHDTHFRYSRKLNKAVVKFLG
jgi:pimeloyl-ACP methyl ester carboxylesterase